MNRTSWFFCSKGFNQLENKAKNSNEEKVVVSGVFIV